MKKIALAVSLIFCLYVGIIYMPVIVSGALGQEKKPAKHLLAITKLKFTGSDYEKIYETDNDYTVYLSDTENDDTYRNIKKALKEKGWSFKEQLGSGHIFEKDGEKDLNIITRQYSSSYFLWEVPMDIMEEK